MFFRMLSPYKKHYYIYEMYVLECQGNYQLSAYKIIGIYKLLKKKKNSCMPANQFNASPAVKQRNPFADLPVSQKRGDKK